MLPRLSPTRRLVTAGLLMTAGSGAFAACSAIYFTRVGGLTLTEMGLGLTIACAIGMVVGVPLGHLADRRGPQRVAVLLVALNGVAAAGYLLVRGFPVFVLVASCSPRHSAGPVPRSKRSSRGWWAAKRWCGRRRWSGR
jgi:MFS family permease